LLYARAGAKDSPPPSFRQRKARTPAGARTRNTPPPPPPPPPPPNPPTPHTRGMPGPMVHALTCALRPNPLLVPYMRTRPPQSVHPCSHGDSNLGPGMLLRSLQQLGYRPLCYPCYYNLDSLFINAFIWSLVWSH
jgi:hypothetical protein